MRFDSWINNFVNNNNDKKVPELVASIRKDLEFNDCPSFEMMENGVVDCVGAATITARILNELIPEYKFKVAALPQLPWVNPTIADSKHCGVIQFRGEKLMHIIDPTPINAYGYGRISGKIDESEWVQKSNLWSIIKWPQIEEFGYWERILYPSFLLIDDEEIERILHIDNARSFLRRGEVIELSSEAPIHHTGWMKEYWRTQAQIAIRNNKVEASNKFYLTAVEIAPYNSYLLEEYILFAEKNKVDSNLEILKRNYEKYTRSSILAHERAVTAWNKKLNECVSEQNWESYLYYLGMIFWREQSISLLKKQRPEEIESVFIDNKSLPLYRLSPAWFKNNKRKVCISKEMIKSDLVLAQFKYRADPQITDFYRSFLGLSDDDMTGYVSIVDKNSDVGGLCTRNSVDSHRLLFGLIKRELLII